MAGNQKGQDDERYLWPEFSRLVAEVKPRWVVAENVPGIIKLAADDVCQSLEHLGYAVGIWNFEAAAVGALHRRARIFFVGHSRRGMRERGAIAGAICEKREREQAHFVERPGGTSFNINSNTTVSEAAGVADVCQVISNSDGTRFKEQQPSVAEERERSPLVSVECGGRRFIEPSMGGVADGLPSWLDGYWRVEPDIPRTATGIKNRVSRLRALGNAVVPAQAYLVFRAIAEAETLFDSIED